MDDLTWVQGDTAPSIVAVLHEPDDPDAKLDLTDATAVAFQMRKPDDRRYTVNAVAEVDGDPVDGRVKYDWAENDLSVAGTYQAQWEVTFGDGKVQTTKTPVIIEVRRQ